MEHYDYAKVMSDPGGVRVTCTAPEEIESLISELKRFFPKMLIIEVDKAPSGETYFWHLKGFSSKDDSARFWIMKQLCARGWEPLGGASVVFGTNLHYEFRRKSNP